VSQGGEVVNLKRDGVAEEMGEISLGWTNKLKAPKTVDENFEDVVRSAQPAAVRFWFIRLVGGDRIFFTVFRQIRTVGAC
jgi:hypothetical protein